MELLHTILTIIGFFAVTFGVAGTLSKWFKAAEERKIAEYDNYRRVIEALGRIETRLNSKP